VFLFAALIAASALAQSDTTLVVLYPNPYSQGHGHPVPMLMPSAYVTDDGIYVEYPYSIDMTLIVRREDDEIVETEYFYATNYASITGLVPDEYYLEVIIGDRTFRGEFEIE
jgi:hypothetical protein